MRKLGKKIVCYATILGMLMSYCPQQLTVNAMSGEVATYTDAEVYYTETEDISEEDTVEITTQESVETTEVTTEALDDGDITTEIANDEVKEETGSAGEEAIPQDGDSFTINHTNLTGNQSAAEAQGNFSVSMNGAVQSGYSDYTSYMTEHVLNVDGKEIKDGDTIVPSKDFALSLYFKLKLADMAANGLKYYYELPEHITIGDQGSEEETITLYNGDRVAIGNYYIKDDVMYVSFPGYYDEVIAYFNMDASWDVSDNSAQIEVKWNNDVDTYNIDICDLSVVKTHTGYITNKDDNGMSVGFKIKVSPNSEDGTINNITLTDSYSLGNLKIDENTYGSDKAVKVTTYNADKTVAGEPKFYNINDIINEGSSVYGSFSIPGLSVETGGYFLVEYVASVTEEQRMEIDASAGDIKQKFINTAIASYPYYDTELGKEVTLSTSAKVESEYGSNSAWIYKEQGREEDTKVTSSGTTIVPYVVTINKHRRYSLGGSIVRDEISEFVGGDVVYYTAWDADTRVEWLNKAGSGEMNQVWIFLDDATYAELNNLATTSSTTAYDNLRANAALKKKLMDAINAEVDSSNQITDFDEDAALRYVFTTEAANNFIWITPPDDIPTTYTINYQVKAVKEVGSFKNSAALWYTEYDAVPPGPGVGWTKPVKKVLNATKENYGVYIGEDGNYYVDYKITVGLEKGSAGFDGVSVRDIFPHNKVVIEGQEYVVFDWLAGFDGAEVNLANFNTPENIALVSSVVDVSTTSTDEAVKKVVDNAYSFYFHEITGDGRPSDFDDRDFRSGLCNFDFINGYYNTKINEPKKSYWTYEYMGILYRGAPTSAGQFVAKEDLYYSDKAEPIKKGTTISPGSMMIWLGDLPGTDVGYDIDIRFTMQVNPELVKYLPNSPDKYITNNNKAEVFNAFMYNEKETVNFRTDHGLIHTVNSPYWLSIADREPGLTKNVNEGSYDEAKNTLEYTIVVNPNNDIKAENTTYEITDVMGVAGLKYIKSSMVIKDSADNTIYSNGKPATAYKDIISVTMSDSASDSNDFVISLDNKGGEFTTATGELEKLTITYKIDTSTITTDTNIGNDAALVSVKTNPTTGAREVNSLGEAHVDYAIDKALDKHIKVAPNSKNDYTVSFYVDVNPNSVNAKELADVKVGETFTLKDTLGSELQLNINTVKIFTYQGDEYANPVDITSKCKKAYDKDNGQMVVDIPVSDLNDKYRIEYDARVNGGSNDFIAYDNEVTIEGTKIKTDIVKDRVLLAHFNQGSDAATYAISLVKYDRYSIEKRLEAEFNLYKLNIDANGDESWTLLTTSQNGYDTIKTEANGQVIIANSIYGTTPVTLIEKGGWYKLEEIDVQAGYVVSNEPTYYYVVNPNVADVETPDSIEGSFQTVILAEKLNAAFEEYPVLYVANQRFGFDVRKLDRATAETLEGAEFTLYTDSACTKALAKATSGADGIASFRDLDIADLVNNEDTFKLYLKETKVPDEYQENNDVIALTITDGWIKEAYNQDSESYTVNNKGTLSVLDVTNERLDGRLSISKTVDIAKEPHLSKKFAFTAKIYNPDGTESTKEYPTIIKDLAGNETTGTYKSGSIFYLKHGQTMIIEEIEDKSTYEVDEVRDTDYVTQVIVNDSVNRDDRTGYRDTNTAKGTIETGNIDEVEYLNKPTVKINFTKVSVDNKGNVREIPDGLTIEIHNLKMEKFLVATWDASKGKFIATYKAVGIEFDNSTEKGFEVTGVQAGVNETYTIYETGYEIEGMICSQSLSGSRTAKSNNGVLVVEDVRNSNSNEFEMILNNRYTDENEAAKVTLELNKSFNKDIPANTFEFALYEGKNTDDDEKVLVDTAFAEAGTGKVSFDLKFNRDAVFWYTIEEIIPENAIKQSGEYVLNGVTYDIREVYVRVNVTEDVTTGKFTTEVTYEYSDNDDSLEFINTYNATATWEPKATKTLLGSALGKGDYSFVLTEYTDDTYTAVKKDDTGADIVYKAENGDYSSVNKNAPVDFGEISYDYNVKGDVGKHYYILKEDLSNANPYVDYDYTEYKIVVDVKDNDDGTLSVSATYNNGSSNCDSADFVNKYEASGEITISGTKTMEYMDMDKDQFTFLVTEYVDARRTTVKKVDGKPVVYEIGHKAATLDGTTMTAKADFSHTITYSGNDIGTHYYRVTEKIPEKAVNNVYNDVIYDNTQYNFVVEVSDNGDGTLAAISRGNDSTKLNFTNAYYDEVEVDVEITKELLGRELVAGEFGFMVQSARFDNATGQMDATAPPTQMFLGMNTETGTVYDNKFIFSTEDAGYTYYYYFMELPYGPTGVTPGITFDSRMFGMSVKVYFDEKGDLKADKEMMVMDMNNPQQVTPTTELKFINLYNASGEVTFTSTKLLKNKTIKDKQFKFGIYEGDTLVSEGTNDADGNVSFEPINYVVSSDMDGTVKSDVGEHTYTVKEIIPETAEEGYVYDETEYTIKLEVVDNLDGTLSVKPIEGISQDEDADFTYSVDYPEDKDANFENVYESEAELSLEGIKTLEGRELKDEEFTFEAVEYKLDGENEVATGRKATATNDADGNITFDKINFTLDKDTNDVGVYVYRIKEVVPEDTKGVTYDTTEHKLTFAVISNDGNLEVVPGVDNKPIEFKNLYEANGEVTLEGVKNITYLDEASGISFEPGSFTFTVKEVNADGTTGDSVTTGKTMADNTIAFEPIKYTLADVGIHKYVITEDVDNMKPGVLYKAEPVALTVNVSDKGDGTLDMKVSYENDAAKAEFTNELTKVKIAKLDDAGKPLKGAKLQIVDSKGNVVYEYTTTEDFEMVYGLQVDETYILREIKAPKGYEKASDIEFSLDKDGVVSVTIEGKTTEVDTITMVDKKTPTTTTEVKTGDATNVFMAMVMLLISLGGILYIKRKKYNM